MKAVVVGIALTLLAAHTHAKLEPIADEELSQYTGQAFLQIDNNNVGNTDFTRFTFGMDVETLLTSDLVELGRYERSGEPAGSSDIRINDFALGSINADGSINPFKIRDPFIELAYETEGNGDNAKENLVGVRLGFGEALGQLSGNIEYLSGKIEVDVRGSAGPIRSAASGWERFLLSAAGVDDDTQLEADAELVDAFGNPDQIRAQLVGIKNGDALGCVSGCNLGGLSNWLLSLFKSDDCGVMSLSTCFELGDFRTLDIGKGNGQAASGLFLSIQTKSVEWQYEGGSTVAPSGAFMNIPNGGITVNFEQSLNGTERVRTKFLDPYYD